MMKIFRLFSLLVLIAFPAFAANVSGKVIAITDGDTLTLLNASNTQVKVRLAEIDTPESKQPYGTRAKQELSNLAFGKKADVAIQDIDRYGRTVGRVYVEGTDVNAEMVQRGAAWVYRQYAKDPALLEIEAEAKALKRGLWALPEAERTAPWEWRKAKRVQKDQMSSFDMSFVPAAYAKNCCKVCQKGKPCGDSCIKKTSQCTKPPGCAC